VLSVSHSLSDLGHSPAIRKELDLDRFPAISHLTYSHVIPERVAFYNPVGPEPPTYPLPPEEITPRPYFADIFSLVNPAGFYALGIYNIAAARNCEGSYPRDAECAYID